MKKIICLLLCLTVLLGVLPAFAAEQAKDLVSTATSVFTSREPDYSVITGGYDRNDSTVVYVGKENDTTGGWFAVELEQPSVITSIAVKTRPYISAANCSLGEFAGFVFEAANKKDFSDAVILYDDSRSSSELENSQLITYTHNDTLSAYKYVRIRRKNISVICFAEFYVTGYGVFNTGFSDSIPVSAAQEGYYAVSFEAMTGNRGALVNITNNSLPLKNIKLSNPGLTDYTKHYSVIKLNKGNNVIGFNHSTGMAVIQNLSVTPLPYLTDNLLSSFVRDVNTSPSAFNLRDTMNGYFEYFGIDENEVTSEIFYDIPIYECMANKQYESTDEIINDFFAYSANEKYDPTVVVTGNGEVQTEFNSGDYVVTVNTKRLSESCKVVTAVYEGNSLAGVGHSISNDSGVVTIPLKVNLSGTGDIIFKVMYISDFDTLRPIDAYPRIYADIYMSASGSDDADGSEQNPYATFDAVKTRIAKINDDMTGDIIVHVEDGVYPITETVTFTEEHGGKNGYNVIIKGDGVGDNPVFTGGTEVTGWQEYRDGIYKAPLDIEGDVRNLYIDGYGAVRARSSYKYKLEEFFNDTDTEYSKDGFYVSIDGIPSFAKPQELELVWNLSWQAHRTPVESIDESNGRYLFHMTNPCFDIEFHESVSPIAIKEGSTFYIENALELLDEEGEFYFDGDYIYYKPYPEETLSECKVYVSETETLFNIGGSSNNSKIENIIIKNLDVRLGAWNKVSQSGLVGNQADLMYTTDLAGTTIIPAQFVVRNADGVHIEDCNFSDMGSGAVSMMDAVTNSSVRGCSFSDISGTGVIIGNPTKAKVIADNKCANICVVNNIFRRVASEYHQTMAIASYHGNGFNVRNNDIKKLPYTGINVGWGWETHGENSSSNTYPPDGCGYYDVSANRIEDSMLVLMDGASIYSLDHGPSAIRGNYIVNSCGAQQYGIYLDSSSRNTVISDNVIEDSQRWLNVAGSYIANITARNNYYTIPISNYLSDVTTLTDNVKVTDTYPLEAQYIIADAGINSEYSSAPYETPDWRKESIDTIPKYQYLKNGHIRSAVLFDDCYDPTTQIVDTRLSRISFNKDEWVSYNLPTLESGRYKLTVTASREGTSPAEFKVYMNNSWFSSLTGSVAATGSWAVSRENECGNITIDGTKNNTIKFKITSSAFEFESFKLEKID